MSELSTLPPAIVPGNDWRSLNPPEIGAWEPSRSVSVVIPAYQAQRELELLFAVLCEQTYPTSLVQVVVVDDGSTPPLELSGRTNGLEVELVYRERDGSFSSGAARNAGVKRAEGEILVFLDADMLPGRQMIEAHARWHHVACDAVTLGFREHVDVDGLDPDDLRKATRSGGVSKALKGRKAEGVDWIERFVERTDDLTARRLDLFKVVTGGNLALRAETYNAVGGMHEFGIRGTEDTELGYRLSNYGALLVPERRAMSWHQGRGFFKLGGREGEAKRVRAPVLANYIPVGGFRSEDTQRIFAVPTFGVEMTIDEEPGAEIVEVVVALLSGYFDLCVAVVVGDSYHDRAYLEDAFTADPRVRVVDEAERETIAPEIPFRVLWSTRAVPGPSTFPAIHKRMLEEPLGALHVTVPGEPSPAEMIHVFTSGALARSTRLASRNGGARDEILGELFGERWMSGVDLGIQALGDAAPGFEDARRGAAAEPAPSATAFPPASLMGKADLAERLHRAEQTIEKLRQRKAMRIATNAGRVGRRLYALGPRGLRTAVRRRDLRAVLARIAMLGVMTLAFAAVMALVVVAALSESTLALVIGAVAILGATAAITAVLTDPKSELGRLSSERDNARSERDKLRSKALRLERRAEELENSLSEAEQLVTKLEQGKKAPLGGDSPPGREPSYPAPRPPEPGSSPVTAWLTRWRQRRRSEG